jgi:hypothetical protein
MVRLWVAHHDQQSTKEELDYLSQGTRHILFQRRHRRLVQTVEDYQDHHQHQHPKYGIQYRFLARPAPGGFRRRSPNYYLSDDGKQKIYQFH